MKQKGFTLVELLVVMVILGIITAISIPLVRNVQSGTEEKEYSTYQRSVQYAAKLYVDSYEEDIFGNEKSGCAIISYEELKEKNFLKDIDLKDISCASDDTYVRVVKIDGKYGYSVSIGCGKKDENGTVTVNHKLPIEETVSTETCSVDAKAIMTFTHNITDPESISYKKRAIGVIVSSNTGVNSDPIIKYGFSASQNSNIVGNWETLDIQPGSSDSQISQIENGHVIRVTSAPVETPTGLTGSYYLVLRIDRLQDVSGKDWAVEGSNNYVYLGPFTIDNTLPSFNSSTVVSSESGYNSLKPKLNLSVTDQFSPSNRLKMCISYETDTCPKERNSIPNYEVYNPSKTLEEKIHNTLDGSNHKVYVTIVDAAGNFATKEFSYQLAHTITYHGNGSTGGSTAVTYCNKNATCTLRDNGFSKTGYHYTGWFTQASGGSKYGSTVTPTSNLNIYAQWVDDIKPTCTATKVAGMGDEAGLIVQVTCSDNGSQCVEATHNYNSVREDRTFTVYDNAGNSGTCSVSVSNYACHPYQYQCGTYVCGYYTCCSPSWGHGEMSGQVLCDTCVTRCNTYCTGYRTCYQ